MILRRWLKFNLVSAIGIVLQLAVLSALVSGLRWNYLLSTAVAVEIAVLHNFAWHIRYTWADRSPSSPWDLLLRLLRFHFGNGGVSLFGNLILMRLLVGRLHLPYLPANLISIGACGLLNFALGEWFVFRPAAPRRPT